MKLLRTLILFSLGGTAYVSLEFLWRRRSHISMFLLGGLCFLLVGKGAEKFRRIPVLILSVFGAGVITLLELVTGLLFNRNHRVWDYRDQPFHYRGQICLLFSLLWAPVSLVAMKLYALSAKAVDRLFARKKR